MAEQLEMFPEVETAAAATSAAEASTEPVAPARKGRKRFLPLGHPDRPRNRIKQLKET
jgi:hypothetical protein